MIVKNDKIYIIPLRCYGYVIKVLNRDNYLVSVRGLILKYHITSIFKVGED